MISETPQDEPLDGEVEFYLSRALKTKNIPDKAARKKVEDAVRAAMGQEVINSPRWCELQSLLL